MCNAAGQLTHCLKLLRLAQSGFGCSVFGHLRLQTKIGLIEFEAEPHRLREESVEVRSGERKSYCKDDDHYPERAIGSSALGEEAGCYRQACRKQESEKGRQMRCV